MVEHLNELDAQFREHTLFNRYFLFNSANSRSANFPAAASRGRQRHSRRGDVKGAAPLKDQTVQVFRHQMALICKNRKTRTSTSIYNTTKSYKK